MSTNRFSHLSFRSMMVALSVLAVSMFVLLPAASAAPINPGTLNPYTWLDASDASTLYQDTGGTTPDGNGDPVALWKDKGSGGNDFAQASTFAQPLYATSGFHALSRPSVNFDGAGDSLQAATASAWKFLNADGSPKKAKKKAAPKKARKQAKAKPRKMRRK